MLVVYQIIDIVRKRYLAESSLNTSEVFSRLQSFFVHVDECEMVFCRPPSSWGRISVSFRIPPTEITRAHFDPAHPARFRPKLGLRK